MKRSADIPLAYKGERACALTKRADGMPCVNNAYFFQEGLYCCGVHRDKKRPSVTLKVDPMAADRRHNAIQTHAKDCIWDALRRKEKGEKGTITLHKMRMMALVPLTPGAFNIFPNNKHGGRRDGKGMPELSPMRLGPVKHRQPSLPPSLNIENYHQGNKVWPTELNRSRGLGDLNAAGNLQVLPEPSVDFYALRQKMYLDPVPHRHKFPPAQMKKEIAAIMGAGSKNSPLYSVHETLDGEEKRFTYVQSRYFYSVAYEVLAGRTMNLATLREYLRDGYNLVLCGYDAYDLREDPDPGHDLYWHYCNPARPFGHELVLYALLTISDPHDYPWHRYRREHPTVYENIASVASPASSNC